MRFPAKLGPLLLAAIFLGLLALKATATTYYVDVNSTNPTPPYTDWSTASTDIQSAIDLSTNGDLILVNPGIYQTGGRTVNGYALTNRVVIDLPVTVESVSGPAETIIEGYQVPVTTNDAAAVRCVYMTNDAVLIGFTLTNGATQQFSFIGDNNDSGGGIWCEDNSAIISNCVFSANTSDFKYGGGGGVLEGTLYNCTLIGNLSSTGGGAYGSVMNNCTLTANSSILGAVSVAGIIEGGDGGAVSSCTLNQCVLTGNLGGTGGAACDSVLNGCVVTNNVASGVGGGAANCTLNDCFISGNSAEYGGGTRESILTNCTLTGNSAYAGGGSYKDTVNGCILSSNSASAGGGMNTSTLTNCIVMDNSAGTGGGADGGTIYNCILYGNVSSGNGGGVNSATVKNSALFNNSAVLDGGGAASCTLASCTLTGNSASFGGGAFSSSLTNCIVYYNNAIIGTNYDTASSLAYCCTTPLPTNGPGNIADEPDLPDNFHLGEGSPCIGAGNAMYVTGVDIDGYPWMNPPAIGCDDSDPGTPTGPLAVAIGAAFTNLATGFTGGFTAQIIGHATVCIWNFGDGNEIANQPFVSHAWTTAGTYQVSLWAYNESNPAGVSATITVQVMDNPVQYAAQGDTTPVAPYLSWATAATNIQDAVNAAFGGGTILVSNGVYQSGGYSSPEGPRCVAATQPITLLSVNGPAATFICGSNLVGCVYLANGAMLSGFTLTNGWFPSGGGVYCASTNTLVTNCILINNLAYEQAGDDAGIGGGAYSGTLINCTLQSNSAAVYGGGAAYSTLLNCTIAGNQGIASGQWGGAAYCTLSNCVVAGNSRVGVAYCTAEDCIIESNTPSFNGGYGGGAIQSTLNNCLICGNQGGTGGGGAYDCTLNFCVISNNVAGNGGGIYEDNQDLNGLGQSNIVVGNVANGDGGGVCLGGNNAFNLSSWTFNSNSAAGNGGGVSSGYSGSIVSNCTFAGNFARGNGGGCYSATATPVSDCTFLGNGAAGEGGGAYAVLTNCSVSGNRASYGGGDWGLAYNCIFNSNVATNNGGGLYADLASGFTPANCAFTNNSALNGGGVYVGEDDYISLTNCVFWANSATNDGGGIALNGSKMANCYVGNNFAGSNGGGVYNYEEGRLSGCIISSNLALSEGGGVFDAEMTNCLINGNIAAYGGGAYYNNSSYIFNCTIAGNRAVDNAGGAYWAGGSPEVVNSIIYDNFAPTNVNYAPTNALTVSFNFSFGGGYYCCTTPLPVPLFGNNIFNSNFTNDPAFVNPAAGDFHLQSSSPCINSGYNSLVAGSTDLDGNPRIAGGTVDMGTYEYQTPVSLISYHWLQQYGLPITTNIDTSNLDGTSFDVYQNWIAGLNPTNPASVLVMLPPVVTASSVTVRWESVTNISYNLLRATNLASPFSTIQANITAYTSTTSYIDTTATNSGPYVYRVAVP